MKETERPREEVQRSGTEDFGFLVLANSYRRVMEFGKARQVCLEGLERRPTYLSARMALAVILLGNGESEEAQSELEAVIEAAPSNVLARRLLGTLHQDAGNLEKAKRQFEELLWLFPGHKEALRSFAELEKEIGLAEPKEAKATEIFKETNAGEEFTIAALPSENKFAIESPKETFCEEMLFPEFMDIDESEPPYTHTLSELHEEQKQFKETHHEEGKNNPSADLLLFDYEQENTIAEEEKFSGEKGDAEEESKVVSINLDFLDPEAEKEGKELPAEEEPTKTGELPFGNQIEPTAEVEDIGSDLGAKPNKEPNVSVANPLDDPHPAQVSASRGVEESLTFPDEGERKESAPDKLILEKEGTIERLESLLQKIRAKKED